MGFSGRARFRKHLEYRSHNHPINAANSFVIRSLSQPGPPSVSVASFSYEDGTRFRCLLARGPLSYRLLYRGLSHEYNRRYLDSADCRGELLVHHHRWLALIVVLGFFPVAAWSQDGKKIGDTVPKLRFTDIRYLPRTLDDFGPKKAYVLVFLNTTCPLAQRYLPVLQALEKDLRDKQVQFVGVNSAEEDSLLVMATHAVRFDIEFPFVKDFQGDVAKTLGVRRTPEVVVLDGAKRLRYRGRIDNQYRLGGVRAAPTRKDLHEAIDAVLAGREVAIAETEVDGCPITFSPIDSSKSVTYSRHVAPILRKHCLECHDQDGSAPFALANYKQVAARAESVAEVVNEQRMPPWFASHEFGPFVNRRALSDEERSTILQWVRSGSPRGEEIVIKQPATKNTRDWQIGTPDLVLDSITFDLPEKGDIPYKYAILPHVFAEDTWVQGIQIKPDNPAVLHHCNMAYATVTEGFNESNFITGYVPGGENVDLHDGIAVLLPAGSVLALQHHFVPTGKKEKCKVSVGLRFPREPVQRRLRSLQVTDRRFSIPPGAPAHKVAASRTLAEDSVGVGMFSHMHLRGRDMTFSALSPSGKTETLLIVPNYSFSWQIPYRWEPGKATFAKGTKIECVARFDNSAFNPYNPNPLATVRFGQQTHHEMMYGFFFYTHAQERLALNIDPKTGTERKHDASR